MVALFALIRTQLDKNNPYESPNEPSFVSPKNERPQWLTAFLIAFAFVGVLPPLPMMIMLGEAEPFIVPDTPDIVILTFNLGLGFAWLVWAIVVLYAWYRRWYPSPACLGIILAFAFGSLSFFNSYLFLADPAGRKFLESIGVR